MENGSIGWAPPAQGWIGTASCASAACHGADGPQGTKGCEYSTWKESDPHSRAYDALFSERSLRMARVLWPDEKTPEPWKKSECLACHTSFESAKEHADSAKSPDGTSPNPQYGVGCESCHGPARDWIGVHTTNEWQALSPTEKERLGFRNLTQPLARAETCVRCHTGSPNQEVNHDLIAAGHPRLFFNLVGFSESPPTMGDKSYRGKWHWLSRRNPIAGSEESRGIKLAREWAVGEVVAAIASLDLLNHRLNAADKPSSNWPELAEFNCYACHHDLSEHNGMERTTVTIPKASAPSKPVVGRLAWGAWSFATIPSIAEASGLDAEKIRISLETLRRLIPGNDEDRRAAMKVVTTLKQYLQSDLLPAVEMQSINTTWLNSVRGSLIAEAKSSAPSSTWDQAAAWYIAFVVLDRLQQDLLGNEGRRMASSVPSGLLFPKGFDSPRGFSPKMLADFLKTVENTNP
ncbi:cytochrome c family protein [bacterium]|nr:cytochrome c family protein [bacterium]